MLDNNQRIKTTQITCLPVRGPSPVSLFFQWVTVTNPRSGASSQYNLLQDPGAQFTAISNVVRQELCLEGVVSFGPGRRSRGNSLTSGHHVH